MIARKGGDSPAVDTEALKRACAAYREVIYRACYGVLGDAHDAEDATNKTIEKVLLRPPRKPVKSLEAWLYGAGRHTALDMAFDLRRTVPVESFEDSASPDQFRASRLRADVSPFIDKVLQFLTDDIRKELGLEETRRGATRAERAARLDLLADRLEEQPAKVRDAVDYAGFVACLVADPGQGANLCAVPKSLAKGSEPSPQLLKKIKSHVRKCDVCSAKRGDTRSLFRAILLGIGGALALPGLGRLCKTLTAKSSVAAAGLATTAAGVIVVLIMIDPGTAKPEPGWALRPTRPAVPPPGMATASSIVVNPPTVAGTSAIPKPPEPPPSVEPPAPPAATTTAGPVARDDRPPSISQARLEHKRIATKRSRCDDDAPTTSKVLAVVSGAGSVTLIMRLPGRVVEQRMVNVDDMWFGQVGPFPEEDAGQVEVTVRAVGTNDAETSQKIGTVCVTRCAGGSSDDEW